MVVAAMAAVARGAAARGEPRGAVAPRVALAVRPGARGVRSDRACAAGEAKAAEAKAAAVRGAEAAEATAAAEAAATAAVAASRAATTAAAAAVQLAVTAAATAAAGLGVVASAARQSERWLRLGVAWP